MKYLVGLLVLFTVSMVQAQDDLTCGDVINQALASTVAECSRFSSGSLCVGHDGVDGITGQSFSPGTVQANIMVSALTLSNLDLEEARYGIVISKLDNDATLLLFGEAEFENLSVGVPSQEVRVTYPTGSFARAMPTKESDVVAPLLAGHTILTTGRLEDNSWYRVAVPGVGTGWVSSSVISGDNLDALQVVEESDSIELTYRPMYDLNLRTGLNDGRCPQGFESGLLVQTTDEVLLLYINHQQVEFQGTAFIQVPTPETLFVTVLEGEVSLDYDDETYTIIETEQLVIANEVMIQDYDYERVKMLPIDLLPRTFMLPVDWEAAILPPKPDPLAGITPEDDCTVAVVNDVNVRSGPGLAYPLRGTIRANQSAKPDGRAVDAEGNVWWRLTPGAWIRFDVAFNVGMCSDLRIIEALPRLISQ